MSLLADGHAPGRVTVGLVPFDPLTVADVVERVRDSLSRGLGGRVAVVDAAQHRRATAAPDIRAALAETTLVLAGSRVVVAAARLAGRVLPQRISAAVLVDAICSVCVSDRRTVYLVGGAAGRPGVPSGAQRAAAVLGLRHRRLSVVGCANPADDERLLADLVDAKPDVVLVDAVFGVVSSLAQRLRAELPATWVFGYPGLVDVVVGDSTPRRRLRGVPRLAHAIRLFVGATAVRLLSWWRPIQF